MEEFVDMLHAMVPEQHHFPFRYGFGPFDHQLHYIIKMPAKIRIYGHTYLLL